VIVLAILLASGGLLLLCRLAFYLTVYALPLFTAATADAGAHALGAGLLAWALLAALAGVAALAAGYFAMDILPPSVMRTVVVALFAAPAGGAGYHLAHELTALIAMSEPWRQLPIGIEVEVFAILFRADELVGVGSGCAKLEPTGRGNQNPLRAVVQAITPLPIGWDFVSTSQKPAAEINRSTSARGRIV
jgi:hypothetical protein